MLAAIAISKYPMMMDPLSTEKKMNLPSIPYYENVNSKICDAHLQKDFDKIPRIYSQICCSGSSAEDRPSEDSKIFRVSKAAQKLEMNVGANLIQSSSKQSFSCHDPQNPHLIPTNDNVGRPDSRIQNLNQDSAFSTPKRNFFIFPRWASCAFSPADRRTPSSPVVISLELLDSLRGLSLPLAASTVGISATAFKKACRRLGVTRWEYHRGPSRASSKNVGGPTGPVATSQPRTAGRASRPSRTAGEDVDMQLAGEGTAGWVTKELADWLRGEVAEVGSAGVAEPEDDTLVLQMLALRWPVTTAVPALD